MIIVTAMVKLSVMVVVMIVGRRMATKGVKVTVQYTGDGNGDGGNDNEDDDGMVMVMMMIWQW